MSYLAMARRFRPRNFSEVIAQSHITETLQRAIDSDRVASAYLFTGPRGSGKTTVARILAKAINCDKAKKGEPCAQCETCTNIADGRSLDVLEIDGASNNSVDDVRELRENVRYAASAPGKRKVYIIDEVHMLSTGAFNALLKTLEEPPAHVLFVFATTEPRKVPQTILSRCQRFDFRRLLTEEIQGRLRDICKKEKLDLDDAALQLLAKRADGSMRDGLSLLDQVTSSKSGKIRETHVAEILGLVRDEVYLDLSEAMLSHDSVRALELLHAAQREGADPSGFVVGLVEHLRNLLLLSVDPALRRTVQLGEMHLKRAEQLAARFRTEDLLYLLNRAAGLHEEVRGTSQPSVVLEAAMVELARFESRVLLSEVLEKLGGATPERATSGGEGGGTPSTPRGRPTPQAPKRSSRSGARASMEPMQGPGAPMPGASASPPPRPERAEQLEGPPPAAGGPYTPPSARGATQTLVAGTVSLDVVRDDWSHFTQRLAQSKAMLAHCLSEGLPTRLDGQKLHVQFTDEQRFHVEMLQNQSARADVDSLLEEHFGCPLHLLPCLREAGDPVEEPPSVSRLTHEDIVQSRREALGDVMENTPRLQEILDAFDGEILEDREP